MRRTQRFVQLVVAPGLAAVLASRSAAQTPAAADATAAAAAAASSAAAAISAADLARHISVIANDSMMGRNTPSPGLEKTARYVASQFGKLGLIPGGRVFSYEGFSTDQPWFQRYPITGQLLVNRAQTSLVVQMQTSLKSSGVVDERGAPVQKSDATTISFADAARFVIDTVPEPDPGLWIKMAASPSSPRTVLVAGPHTLETVRQADLNDAAVIYVPAAGTDSTLQRQITEFLFASHNVVVLPAEDAATFEQRRAAASKRSPVVIDYHMQQTMNLRHWAVGVRADALEPLLSSAGLDVAQARTASAPIVRELPGASAELQLSVEEPAEMITAPNVVGLIPGSDTAYRSQCIIFIAHLDHRGTADGRADGAPDGADDNASGVAGLIELAKAFTRPGAPVPRRTMVFMAVSGHDQDFAGANYFVNSLEEEGLRMFTTIINLDMLGRKAGDSVSVAGLQDVDFTASARPSWVAGKYGDPGVTAVEEGTVLAPSSDHYAFALKAVPSLYFYHGTHDDPRELRDLPGVIDTEQEARILRLIYYTSLELANVDRKPRWSRMVRQQHLRTAAP